MGRWNTLAPGHQATGRREHDARHLALLRALDVHERRTLRVPYFVGPLTLFAERFHDADVRARLAPRRIALRPTDGGPAQLLEIGAEGAALGPGDAPDAVTGPAEALVRLVYGRLDPDQRLDDRLTGAGDADPSDLRALFRGY